MLFNKRLEVVIMAYINKKDKVLMLELITEKVQKYLSKK